MPSSRYSSSRMLRPVSSSTFQSFPTSRPCYSNATGYQLLLGSDSKFWPTLQPTRRPLTTYRTLFRPTHQLDHSALLPEAALPILLAVQLSLACPDCGASPPSLPSGGMTSPTPLELLPPCPSSATA